MIQSLISEQIIVLVLDTSVIPPAILILETHLEIRQPPQGRLTWTRFFLRRTTTS
jgi:hypothetical protein